MRHTVLDWQRWYEQVIGHVNSDGMADFDIAQAAENGPLFETFADMLAAWRDGLGFALVRSSLVAKDIAEGSWCAASWRFNPQPSAIICSIRQMPYKTLQRCCFVPG
ncbi:hypothetical protein PY650_05785 [Rhizobium calliandrae]|uniref:LysR substrate-binding domain-containing protein n=1 Tax=Rhizobium calliandrae TaxID=1312182 RepID=A0ABT7K9A9_9HYPH|nr:hypothetical protein [Rhizobium calliandrae]MDL2405172.1 hypothetical protein [Rhizobium calliandrae]